MAGVGKDQAKLGIKSVLEELKKNNETGRVKYLRKGKLILMCYSKSHNLTNLQTRMQSQTIDILNELGVSVNRISTAGERGTFYVETNMSL